MSDRRTEAPSTARIALVGVAAGFLSGLFGVGGGILVVPGLVLLLGMDQRLAHGTSLAAIVPIALSGVVGYATEDAVDWTVAVCLVVGSSLGAVVGTHLLHRLSVKTLKLAFALLLAATAVRMLVGDADSAGRGEIDVAMVVGLGLLGFAAGTLAGLFGVGGGIAMVPGMVLGFDLPAAVAKGTSLAVIIPTAIVGTRRNLANDNAALRPAVIVGLAGVVSGFVASKISVELDETLSNRLFAALLAVVAARLVLQVRRDGGDQPDLVD